VRITLSISYTLCAGFNVSGSSGIEVGIVG
jgi:hypothetical protein